MKQGSTVRGFPFPKPLLQGAAGNVYGMVDTRQFDKLESTVVMKAGDKYE